jgi:hypothetical protein
MRGLLVAVEWIAGASVLWLMGWAAIERARLRRQWMRLQPEFDGRNGRVDWCVATAVAAGCV